MACQMTTTGRGFNKPTLHLPADWRKPLGLILALIVSKGDTGFLWWLRGEESTCQCRRPGLGKIPWRREWLPTPVYLAWKIAWTEEPGGLPSPQGCKELDTCSNKEEPPGKPQDSFDAGKKIIVPSPWVPKACHIAERARVGGTLLLLLPWRTSLECKSIIHDLHPIKLLLMGSLQSTRGVIHLGGCEHTPEQTYAKSGFCFNQTNPGRRWCLIKH